MTGLVDRIGLFLIGIALVRLKGNLRSTTEGVRKVRLAHFEVPVGNPNRAQRFYHDLFGWEAQTWEGPHDYWLITTGPDEEPGINGGFMRRPYAGGGATITILVPSIDDCLAHIEQSGGHVGQHTTTIHEAGYIAYCTDTEGNTFGVYERDRSARWSGMSDEKQHGPIRTWPPLQYSE